MKHRSITGTILYTSKKPERLDERRGIEHFRFTHHTDGKRTLRAHCEIEEPHPSVLRDIVYSLDEHGRPMDCHVRLTVDDNAPLTDPLDCRQETLARRLVRVFCLPPY